MKIRTGTTPPVERDRLAGLGGFSLIEALIATVVSAIVLSLGINFLITQMRTLGAVDTREDVQRNLRFLGVSLRHDLHRAGVEIESTNKFCTVAVRPGASADTLIMLHVPYVPSPAPAHPLDPPAGEDNPLAPGGTCGSKCVDLVKAAADPLELKLGDLARLQVNDTRRLLLIQDVASKNDTSFAVTFTAHDTILGHPAGLTGDLLLDRYSTYVQKLEPTVYYLDEQLRLWRAIGLDLSGSPAGEMLAWGVEEFDVKLIFEDGDELERADPNDSDPSNDCDDIVSVRISVTAVSERDDHRVNQGNKLARTHEWLISPRNLRYEKNRI